MVYNFREFQNKLKEGNKKSIFKYLQVRGQKAEVYIDMEKAYPHFISHNNWQEPDCSIAFACVCNLKFLPGLECLILSIKEIYPNFKSDFYVYHDGSLTDFAMKRLRGLYENFKFIKENPEEFDIKLSNEGNHKRVGHLGYLTLHALKLDSYERVILLDADMLVLADISPLWTTPGVNVIMDAGSLPFAVISEYTGKPIINSGVISIPKAILQDNAYNKALKVLGSLDSCTCSILNSFADQKFWNIFLSEQTVNYLPTNFNTNKTLVEKYFPHQLHNVAILHFTGAKPWFNFTNQNYLEDGDQLKSRRAHKDNPVTFNLWLNQYKKMLAAARRAAFQRDMGETLAGFRLSTHGSKCLLIGNGPSINATDFSYFKDMVKVSFNWFVHHQNFDIVKPDHLILPSHMFFGGWNTYEPHFPEGYLEALKSHKHKPTLWISYYFKDYIDSIKQLEEYKICYFLFEKPNKWHADELGWMGMDLTSYLTDNRTGVLSVGVPLAVHLDCKEIFLIGCDSNYQTSKSGDYFYPQELHTSSSTKTSSLESTWQEDGPGQNCYLVALKELEMRNIKIFDATINGSLKVIPKVDYKCFLPITS